MIKILLKESKYVAEMTEILRDLWKKFLEDNAFSLYFSSNTHYIVSDKGGYNVCLFINKENSQDLRVSGVRWRETGQINIEVNIGEKYFEKTVNIEYDGGTFSNKFEYRLKEIYYESLYQKIRSVLLHELVHDKQFNDKTTQFNPPDSDDFSQKWLFDNVVSIIGKDSVKENYNFLDYIFSPVEIGAKQRELVYSFRNDRERSSREKNGIRLGKLEKTVNPTRIYNIFKRKIKNVSETRLFELYKFYMEKLIKGSKNLKLINYVRSEIEALEPKT